MLKKPASRQRAEQIVEAAVAMVRAAPTERFDLARISARFHLSAERFHRVFRSLYGAPFASFVRRVRLEQATAIMRAAPTRALTDVALDAGFGGLPEFSRAFRKHYGCAPSAWNRQAALNLVKITQACSALDLAVSQLFPITPEASTDGIVVGAFPPLRVATLRIHQPHINARLAAGFDRLEAWLAARGQLRGERHFMGLSFDSPLDTAAHEWRFNLGYPVDDAIDGSHDVVVSNLPACTAASKPCSGGVGSFIEAWDALRRRWLPSSDYVADGSCAAREIYFCDPRAHRFAYWEMQCVLPVKRAMP